jgi:SAM-dependent methyltransferase
MGWLFAAIYDPFMEVSEKACLQDWRAALLEDVRGRVLEIGAGTGRSLPYYSDEVTELVLLEPDRHMGARLLPRVPDRLRARTEIVHRPAGDTGLEAASFDVVFSSLVLCSVPDLDVALGEIVRVLKPGGRFIFLEHVADDERPDRLRWQHRLEPAWKFFAGGCHLTRHTDAAIERAGLVIDEIKRESIRKSNPLTRRSIRGVALKPSDRPG